MDLSQEDADQNFEYNIFASHQNLRTFDFMRHLIRDSPEALGNELGLTQGLDIKKFEQHFAPQLKSNFRNILSYATF